MDYAGTISRFPLYSRGLMNNMHSGALESDLRHVIALVDLIA
jgi:hypothetical protein